MKKQLSVIIGVMAVMAVISYMGQRPHEPLPESWLEEKMLTSNEGFILRPMSFDSKISYRMDQTTYDTLKPIGIACQIMQDTKGREIDVVTIAGESMEAFHDQRICFNAQGWELLVVETRFIATKRHGRIPVSWMTIRRPGEQKREAMYIFRTPEGFADYNSAKWGFLVAKSKDPFARQIGFSYRFIGLTPDVNAEDLTQFAIEYLDTLDETTNGVM
ncbi:MAG: exosortase-associated EpsI family protein [Fimbriimonadaceae bacterium]|nr:exosortase-associated EpsI family protein [Fimbriimonadaceae bacterium]